MAPPSISLLGDETANGIRTLKLHVRSARGAPIVTVYAGKGAQVLAYSVNQRRLENKNRRDWGLRFYAIPKDGFDLTLEIGPQRPLL
jgi:hypothetical protein